MNSEKILEMLQPMREVLNDIEGAAIDGTQLSAKNLLDLAEKLIAVDMAISIEYHRELIAKAVLVEAERAELMGAT